MVFEWDWTIWSIIGIIRGLLRLYYETLKPLSNRASVKHSSVLQCQRSVGSVLVGCKNALLSVRCLVRDMLTRTN